MITDFRKDIAASKTNTRHPAVVRAIQEAFPGALAVIEAHEQNDRRGVDVWLELAGQRPIGIDLKIRAKDFAAGTGGPLDCVLELTDDGKPGWAARPSLCQWVLFVCVDTARWAKFRHDDILTACTRWADVFLTHPKCKRLETRTAGTYRVRISLAVAVPSDLLERAIDAAKGGDDDK